LQCELCDEAEILACSFESPEEVGSVAVDGDELTRCSDKACGENVVGCVSALFGKCAETASKCLRDRADGVASSESYFV